MVSIKKGKDMFDNYKQVFEAINKEGLEYFLWRYSESEEMPDDEGEMLFSKAQSALEEFQSYVEQQAGNNDSE